MANEQQEAGFVIVRIAPSHRVPEVMTVRVGKPVGAESAAEVTGSVGRAKGDRRARLGRLAAAISSRGVELLGLSEGQAWTDELAATVAQRLVYEKARRSATRWLARRAMTRAAVSERLGRYTLAASERELLLNELESLGLINDAEYAARAAAARVEREAIGEEALAERIARRGVPADEATAAAKEALRDRSPAEDAQAVAIKRARTMPRGLSEAAVQRRLFQYLARRGFDEEVCAGAVDHVVAQRRRGADPAARE